jgi:hypothetical protein
VPEFDVVTRAFGRKLPLFQDRLFRTGSQCASQVGVRSDQLDEARVPAPPAALGERRPREQRGYQGIGQLCGFEFGKRLAGLVGHVERGQTHVGEGGRPVAVEVCASGPVAQEAPVLTAHLVDLVVLGRCPLQQLAPGPLRGLELAEQGGVARDGHAADPARPVLLGEGFSHRRR